MYIYIYIYVNKKHLEYFFGEGVQNTFLVFPKLALCFPTDFSRRPMRANIQDFAKLKKAGERFTMLTAYDFPGNSVIPALSDGVGAVSWVQSDDRDYYEQIYRLGRYCNSVICVSSGIQQTIRNLHPLIVFDGLPLYEPFHLRLLLSPASVLDPRVVSRLDVHAGGFTAHRNEPSRCVRGETHLEGVE